MAAWLAVIAPSMAPRVAGAICDVYPGPTAVYRGALGSLNRPFAIPGDTGQQIEINLSQAGCDAASPGFLNVGGGSAEDDYFVTVIFKPPSASAARNAVILTTLANFADCDAQASGAPLPGGGTATCHTVTGGTQEFSIPAADTLVFRFPDTDAEFTPDGDDRTYTGPATVAVTLESDPLPFGLASARCADTAGLVACVDELHPADGTCDNSAGHADPVFGHFTALPPANDYQALCNTPGTECTGSASELRFAVDQNGNALIPVDWRGVLLRPDGIPVPRLLRGEIGYPAFASAPGEPVRVPARSFLTSLAPSGRRVPPIFEPLADPSSPSDLVLFGSVDAEVGVMRIARRQANDWGVYQQCIGGANDGLPCLDAEGCPSGTCGPTTCYQPDGTPTATPCTGDSQCGGGQICGPSLFDFSDRLDGDVGPVVVSSSDYSLDAQNPVPLEGLVETPSMFAFVELEAIAGSDAGGPVPQDLNGDGDTSDAVLILRDRSTGVITPIGTASNAGRAATRIHQAPFSAPAVAAEGDIVAFLESEPLQDATDANGDSDVFDSILRVYRMTDCSGTPCADPLQTDDLAVDANPIVEDRSVVVANGLVYFRASEAQNASQTTIRVTNAAVRSGPSFIAGGGRHVTFKTEAVLIPPTGGCEDDTNDGPFTNDGTDVYAYDRDPDGNGIFDEIPWPWPYVRLSVMSDGCQGPPSDAASGSDGRSSGGQMTPDGRFVRFNSAADLDPTGQQDYYPGALLTVNNDIWVPAIDAYLHDRDVDEDGIFDEPGAVETRIVGLSSAGVEADHSTSPSGITPDASYVVLNSRAQNFVSPDPGTDVEDVYIRDMVAQTTELVSVDEDCVTRSTAGSSGGHISNDGRFLAFQSSGQLVAEDTDTSGDVYLLDRDADGDGFFAGCADSTLSLINLAPPEVDANLKYSGAARLSTDGKVAAFVSDATNVVPGDTNGVLDVFVKDLTNGAVTRVSVHSDGTQQNAANFLSPSLSRDGRYVTFTSPADNLVEGDLLGLEDGFVHDRFTGHTARITVANSGAEADGPSNNLQLDEPFVVFNSQATNLTPVADVNGTEYDVFVYGPDTSDPSAEFSGDGRLDDTVLFVLDTTVGTPAPMALAPAEEVSVASDGAAAFLRPEERNGWPLQADEFTCNADGDFDDTCVYLSEDGGPPQDLGREATAVAATPELVAALVPGAGGDFLQVYDRDSQTWSADLGPAADSLQASGSTVTFRAVGTGVLHVYDHATASLTSTGEVAEDHVTGDGVVAFRTRETPATGSLNPDADSDTDDDVMRVWDVLTSQLLETGQAVTPCRFEACRPRRPYRVVRDAVTFLTLEADQGGLDLDGNGNASGIVIQTFFARKAAQALAASAGGGGAFAMASAQGAGSSSSSEVTVLAGVSAGVCTTTGRACSTDDDCGGGARTCFLPPGGCIEDLGTSCTMDTGCPGDEFCVPTVPLDLDPVTSSPKGFCHENHGPCGDDADCSAPAICEDGEQDRVRLFAPLAGDSETGSQLLPALEAGEGTCTSDAQCDPADFCSIPPLATTGVCKPDSPRLVTAGSPDGDGDGVDDVHDNCPRRANPDQADLDGDGAGDVCDLSTCGDGVQTYGEQCDHGTANGSDGLCGATCQYVGPGSACSDGVDNDGDGKVDFGTTAGNDPGCADAADPSERGTGACDDGVDNDGDGRVDFAALFPASSLDDLGCGSPLSETEAPKCQNGLDDDGEPGIDFDGGASLGLSGPADPQCATPSQNREGPRRGCGIGPELAALLPLLTLLRRRRRRPLG